MSNTATTSPVSAFQQLYSLIQAYQSASNVPSQADQAASDATQIIADLQALGASDPSLVATLIGATPANATAALAALTPARLSALIPALASNSTAYIAANPTYAPPGYVTPGGGTTGGLPVAGGGTGTITAPPVGSPNNPTGGIGNPIGLSPTNPIIPVGGSGTTQSGGTIYNSGGTIVDSNGNPVGGTTSNQPTVGGIDAAIEAWANSVGLGSLATWITGQVTTLAGQGLAESDIASVISSTINTAPGFDALMPGYNQRIKNGYTNTDANTGAGIAGYLAYRQQIEAMAETAGMVPGTVSPQLIGNAWAGDVSTVEMGERITTEYTNAVNALPQVQSELQNYGYTAGLSAGQLASYYLNPANTVAQLQQQYNAAVIGGEGVLTGFGEIGQSQAYALQAFLSNQGQSNLTTGQAASFFGGSLGGGLSSLGVMAQTGFEAPQLGTAANGPGVVDQASLIGAGEGNAQDLLKVQRAAQTRAAPGQGGGGFEASQSGVGGVGYGSQ